jgi:hypothetical protein
MVPVAGCYFSYCRKLIEQYCASARRPPGEGENKRSNYAEHKLQLCMKLSAVKTMRKSWGRRERNLSTIFTCVGHSTIKFPNWVFHNHLPQPAARCNVTRLYIASIGYTEMFRENPFDTFPQGTCLDKHSSCQEIWPIKKHNSGSICTEGEVTRRPLALLRVT